MLTIRPSYFSLNLPPSLDRLNSPHYPGRNGLSLPLDLEKLWIVFRIHFPPLTTPFFPLVPEHGGRMYDARLAILKLIFPHHILLSEGTNPSLSMPFPYAASRGQRIRFPSCFGPGRRSVGPHLPCFISRGSWRSFFFFLSTPQVFGPPRPTPPKGPELIVFRLWWSCPTTREVCRALTSFLHLLEALICRFTIPLFSRESTSCSLAMSLFFSNALIRRVFHINGLNFFFPMFARPRGVAFLFFTSRAPVICPAFIEEYLVRPMVLFDFCLCPLWPAIGVPSSRLASERI